MTNRRLGSWLLLLITSAVFLVVFVREDSLDLKATKKKVNNVKNALQNDYKKREQQIKDRPPKPRGDQDKPDDPIEYSRTQQRDQSLLDFVHIPRTGGTAIVQVAAQHGIAWSQCHYEAQLDKTQECPKAKKSRVSYFKDYQNQTPRLKQWAPFWHVPPKYFQDNQTVLPPTLANPYPRATPLFAVVRNPYNRLISEWYAETQQRNQKRNHPKKYNNSNNATQFNLFLKQTLTALSKLKPGGGANGMSRANAYWMHDAHFVPQCDYIYNYAISGNITTQVVQHVLKFENLKEEFAKLMTEYGRDELRLNETFVENATRRISVLSISLANENLTQKVYRQDFERFGYKKSINRQPQLEFVHIPKTGGSTIESLAARHGISWGRCHYDLNLPRLTCPPRYVYRVYIADYLSVTPEQDQWPPFWHVPPKFYQRKTKLPTLVNPFFPPKKPLFAVVRNPYTRLVSEWYFRSQKEWKQGPETYNNVTKFNIFLHDAMTRFSQVQPMAAARADMTRRNPYWVHDAHFVPQYDFIFDDDGTQLVQHVLKFETLGRDFSSLMAHYGLGNVVVMADEVPVNMATDKHLSMANISAENMALVHQIYHRDFESFGYNMV